MRAEDLEQQKKKQLARMLAGEGLASNETVSSALP